MIEISLEIVVLQCITNLQGIHSERDVKLDKQITWPILYIDEEKIHQVCTNVLSNAIKYSPEGGDINISTAHRIVDKQEQFGLSIQDYGIGLSPSQLSRVGERFYRADESGSIPGTGLGLALVKEIMAVHKGKMEIVSKQNTGTTVTIWFPV